MSSNTSNVFNGRRLLLLGRQHFIHNSRVLLYSMVAFVGVAFIVLSVVQLGEGFRPHDLEVFQGFLIGLVCVFGLLFAGYSFPAFRTKESTINYLLLPGSPLEKFVFELVSRIGVMLLLLPLLFWFTFNLQGYFFAMFSTLPFSPVGIQHLVVVEVPGDVDSVGWFIAMIAAATMLVFVLPFTGAAMFSKQPLLKTLFSVAIIVVFYAAVVYIAMVPLGLSQYNPGEHMWLIPTAEASAFRFFAVALIIVNAVMLFVAYRKLKEREV